MGNKINIAELLKDCPKGMELDCAMFDNVTFVRVDNNRKQFPIEIALSGLRSKYLTKDGCFHDNTLLPEAKCVIFPKGKTTWEGFVPPCQFKDGDIVATNTGNWIGITTGGKRNAFIPVYCVVKSDGKFEAYFDKKETWCFERLATKEEKQKLFQAIKDNGYKWNVETKILEKLIEPQFKVGDIIKNKNDKWQAKRTIQTYVAGIGYLTTINDWVRLEDQDNWELVSGKFDINTLVPFKSEVLVRNSKDQCWIPAFFGCKCRDNGYITTFGWCQYCIPYEYNSDLMGSTRDCSDYYKTWKK